MRRASVMALSGLIMLGGAACQEQPPTSVDDGLMPDEPVTVEIRLPWDEFASDLEVLGGYGSPQELGSGVVAQDFAGTLDARTLARFSPYSRSVAVRDSTGSTRADSAITFPTGRVVAILDTLASTNEGPVTLTLSALTQDWHPRTTSWTYAVDTINDRRTWSEPGAGGATLVAESVWDPADGDSVVFAVDSAHIAQWGDTTDTSRGVRLDLLTPGERIKVNNVILRLDVRSTVNPDTAIVLTAGRRDLTFIYDPVPEPPPDGIRIGGAPSWRTVLDVRAPAQLREPATLCAAVGCPLTLTADRLNYAALVLRTRRSEAAFQPTDTVNLDVRPVLLRSALPKAPLGSSLTGTLGRRVSADLFGEGEGAEIEIPVTQFVRDLIEGRTTAGQVPPNTLALLSTFEPLSIAFASFHGPGSADAPVLKLIVTASRSVELP